MSIERTNRLRIALQKAKAGLSIEDEVISDNPSKLGRLLNKKKTIDRERGFIQSQPIHERPVMDAISKEVLGDSIEYQSSIALDKDHPISRLKELRDKLWKYRIRWNVSNVVHCGRICSGFAHQ